MKFYMYKVNVFYRWRETNIFQVYYIVLVRDLSFFSSETQKKILSNDMSENISVVSFSIKTVWIPTLGSRLMVSQPRTGGGPEKFSMLPKR